MTPSCSDEAGQITLSAQPTQSVQNEECEQQSTVFSTVSCSAEVDVDADLFMALYKRYYSKQVALCKPADPLISNEFNCNCECEIAL